MRKDFFYLKRSKEELLLAIAIYKKFNNENYVNKIISYLLNSMDFMIDFINKKHTTNFMNEPILVRYLTKIFDEEFIELYFYLMSLKKSKINFISNSKIIIERKINIKVNKIFFTNLIEKVVNYFNKLYKDIEQSNLK